MAPQNILANAKSRGMTLQHVAWHASRSKPARKANLDRAGDRLRDRDRRLDLERDLRRGDLDLLRRDRELERFLERDRRFDLKAE